MAVALDGVVGRTDKGEFGRTEAHTDPASQLLAGFPLASAYGCRTATPPCRCPRAFGGTAWTDGAGVAAFEDAGRRLYGVQWHPEVAHPRAGPAGY